MYCAIVTQCMQVTAAFLQRPTHFAPIIPRPIDPQVRWLNGLQI
jgi:hypothetical protein